MASQTEWITKEVAALVGPVLKENEFELVDVEYLSKHGKWVLQLTIDKEGGVTIEDCVRVSREIGDLIDVKDIVAHAYVLEVSSPGLNRPLKKENDFIWAIGKKIKLRTKKPIQGRRNYTGYLKDFQRGTLCIEIDGHIIELETSLVEKANLVFEF
jgi:ribosome maturation factor RimP